jgi:hypothetical protein
MLLFDILDLIVDLLDVFQGSDKKSKKRASRSRLSNSSKFIKQRKLTTGLSKYSKVNQAKA